MPTKLRPDGRPYQHIEIDDAPDNRAFPNRRVALQALADEPDTVDLRRQFILPLAVAGIALTLGWYLGPDRAPVARLLLTTATLLLATGGAWLLRSRKQPALAPHAAEPVVSEIVRPPRMAVLPRDFERFMQNGIAVSRSRGRTAALLRIAFVMPELLIGNQDKVLEVIGENARDVTRAYDFVYVPGDGTILIFFAHVPQDAVLPSIAARIVDDLRQCGGPASAALSTKMQGAFVDADDDCQNLVHRVLAETPVEITL